MVETIEQSLLMFYTETAGQSGNVDSCMAMVMVMDTTSPMVSCNNVTVFLDGSGMASVTEGDLTASASDNCSLTDTTISMMAVAGRSFLPSALPCCLRLWRWLEALFGIAFEGGRGGDGHIHYDQKLYEHEQIRGY